MASPLVSCSWWEGQEEAAMEQMLTIVVKLEHEEQRKACFPARQMSKCDDTSTGTATRVARCGLLLEGLGLLYGQLVKLDGHQGF
jgi:hypothetical protein